MGCLICGRPPEEQGNNSFPMIIVAVRGKELELVGAPSLSRWELLKIEEALKQVWGSLGSNSVPRG